MIEELRAARDALTEYYRDNSPVVNSVDSAILEAQEYSRAYELLFKENTRLRAENESLRAQLAEAHNENLRVAARAAGEVNLAQAQVTALRDVLECLIIGACAVAVPHAGERKVLQEAVDIARAALNPAPAQESEAVDWQALGGPKPVRVKEGT